jgi:hypothetical protein
VDPDFALGSDDGTGEDRRSGGQERAVVHDGAIDVGVRSDEHVVTESRRRPLPASHERVLHDDGPRADLDAAVFGRDDGAEQDSHVAADVDITAHHRVGRHVRRRMNRGPSASVLESACRWAFPQREPALAA